MPAFRHARTPLVAGSLWFVALWLALGEGRLVPDPNDSLLETRVHELVTQAGPSLSIAALALAAILVGGLIPPLPRQVAERALLMSTPGSWRMTPWILRRFLPMGRNPSGDLLEGMKRDWTADVAGGVKWSDLVASTSAAPRRLRDMAFDTFDHLHLASEELRAEIEQDHDPADGDDHSADPVPWSMLNGYIGDALLNEADEIAVLLQIEHESLYLEVDRLNSESELRRSIVLPLVALIVVAAALSSCGWLVAGVLPFALLSQAGTIQRESRLRIYSAVNQGLVRSPTLTFLEGFRKAAVERRAADHQRRLADSAGSPAEDSL